MQLTASRTDLSRLLSDVSKVVERRTTIPILANVLLTAGADGSLQARATDLDIEITKTIGANVAEPGSTTVDAARIAGIVSKLSGDVSLVLDNGQLTVKSGRSRFVLPTLPPDDYPNLDQGTPTHTFDVDFNALVAPVKFAVSSEETRYYLCGVYLHQDGNKLVAVATDGHRLARHTAALPEGADGFSAIIVPAKTIAVLGAYKGVVSLSISANKITARADDAVITSKLIDGSFPDYRRVIPNANEKLLVVDKATLAAAVDRAGAITSEHWRAVKVSLAVGGVTLSMRSDDGESSEAVEAEWDADPLDIGFNSRYLTEMLTSASGERVTFALADAGSPALVTAAGNDNWTGVLMPMRV